MTQSRQKTWSQPLKVCGFSNKLPQSEQVHSAVNASVNSRWHSATLRSCCGILGRKPRQLLTASSKRKPVNVVLTVYPFPAPRTAQQVWHECKADFETNLPQGNRALEQARDKKLELMQLISVNHHCATPILATTS